MEHISIDSGLQVAWSSWSRCESSFSMLLVPHRPGILALAEEITDAAGGKRMLALFNVAEARDLSLAVSAMFASGSPLRDKLSEGRCFVRYAMISDPEDRRAVCQALEAWMQATAEQATGMADCDPGDCTAPQRLKPPIFSAIGGRAEALPLRTKKQDVGLGKPAFPAGF
jgi:hypothetical protein